MVGQNFKKWMFRFYCWFSLILSVFAFISFTYIVVNFHQIFDISQNNQMINDNNYMWIIFVLFFVGLMYTSMSAITLIMLIRFAAFGDEFIVNNRYIVIAFSLLSGNIIIPLLLLWCFPNTTTKPTSLPKVVISKTLGIILFWAGLVSAVTLLITFFVNKNYNQNQISQIYNDISKSMIISCIVAAVIAFYGLLNIVIFRKFKINAISQDNVVSNIFLNFISIINLLFISICLIVVMIESIFSFISTIGRVFFEKRNIVVSLLSPFLIFYAFVRMAYICYLSSQTLKILWSNKNCEIKVHQGLWETQNSSKYNQTNL